MNLVDVVEKLHANPNAKNILAFRTGDTVEVAVRIKEGEKTRIQNFTSAFVRFLTAWALSVFSHSILLQLKALRLSLKENLVALNTTT